ncbi:hypothetical protein VP01_3560g3 [Puccinia sorghi]|uniref:Uncharacterized protein n=1 Tax=Puccinia sorghi TaxID=27349 RepID=A0A0L6UVC1_9BASI|nr:hypothetical protein VP01_3560g3 [Puccinia sorghi]
MVTEGFGLVPDNCSDIGKSLNQALDLDLNYWNEVIKARTLTLNQIPAHKSKKSPFELFKNCFLTLNYFKPIRLKVSYFYLSENSNSKIVQISGLGTLVGYNEKLISYRVATETGKVMNLKHLKFLEFPSTEVKKSDLDIEDDWLEPKSNTLESNIRKDLGETISVEEDGLVNLKTPGTEVEGDSECEGKDLVVKILVPEPCILRDRTSKNPPHSCKLSGSSKPNLKFCQLLKMKRLDYVLVFLRFWVWTTTIPSHQLDILNHF